MTGPQTSDQLRAADSAVPGSDSGRGKLLSVEAAEESPIVNGSRCLYHLVGIQQREQAGYTTVQNGAIPQSLTNGRFSTFHTAIY